MGNRALLEEEKLTDLNGYRPWGLSLSGGGGLRSLWEAWPRSLATVLTSVSSLHSPLDQGWQRWLTLSTLSLSGSPLCSSQARAPHLVCAFFQSRRPRSKWQRVPLRLETQRGLRMQHGKLSKHSPSYLHWYLALFFSKHSSLPDIILYIISSLYLNICFMMPACPLSVSFSAIFSA